ncbi:hypothetical protein RB195_019558 [Necator americanus]
MSEVPLLQIERSSMKVDTDKLTQVCSICGLTSTKSRSGLRLDAKMIRPCFCDTNCHHGCLVDRIQLSRLCEVCGASYRYQEYGSLRDFFMRYWCQYSCSFVVLLILFGLAALSITQALKDPVPSSLSKLSVLIIGVVLFGVCLALLWMCVKYTVMRRIPRFQARYGQITVFDYEPSLRNTTQIRRNSAGESKRLVQERDGDISTGKCLPGSELPETVTVKKKDSE